MWDLIWSDPTHFCNNNNESWIILYACQVRRCGVSYSVKKKSSPLITLQIDKHTDRQTDGRTDRHKSFIDMRYYTEQYSKSNSIKENGIELNQIDLK